MGAQLKCRTADGIIALRPFMDLLTTGNLAGTTDMRLSPSPEGSQRVARLHAK